MNAILLYNKKIKSGEIVVCNKIRTVYSYLSEVITDKKSDWAFSEKRANRVIEFVESYCRHSKGKWGGKLVKLELWQKAFLSALFGVVNKETGLRRFNEAVLLVARKNGKSLLASAISIYMMIADNESGAECYAVATKRDQAKIIWEEALKMVKKSPMLLSVIDCRTNRLRCDRFESKFEPLSSESNTLDGLNTHYAGMDEVHAWKDRNLYEVVKESTSARDEPIVLSLSTMGYVRDGIFDTLYSMSKRVLQGMSEGNVNNTSFLPVVYELDSRDEYNKPECWIKANPNLNVSKSIKYLNERYQETIDEPTKMSSFLTKECNIRETVADAYFTFKEIDNQETFDFKAIVPKYFIGSFDLSETTDLTSAGILFEVPDRKNTLFYESMYWLPYDLLDERVEKDKIPYDVWAKQGYLRLCDGNKINTNDVQDWFIEVIKQNKVYPLKVGYDRWSAVDLVNNMKSLVGQPVMYEVKQYAKVLSNPLKMLKREFQAGNIVYNNNPITKWCLTNLGVKTDINGNIQPVKAVSSNARIDGAMALLDAYTAYLHHKEEYRKANEIE